MDEGRPGERLGSLGTSDPEVLRNHKLELESRLARQLLQLLSLVQSRLILWSPIVFIGKLIHPSAAKSA